MGCWQLVFTPRQKDRLISDHFGKPRDAAAAAAGLCCFTASATATGYLARVVVASASDMLNIYWHENHTHLAVSQS